MHKLLLIPLILFACKTSKPTSAVVSSPNNNPEKISSSSNASIAKNGTKIIGKIIKIDSTLSNDAESPCSKVPCRATVKVEQVLEYGSNTAPRFTAGEELTVNFAFTLNATTKDLFPNMTATYPGLKNNSRFIAEVQGFLQMGTDTLKYIIFGYELK